SNDPLSLSKNESFHFDRYYVPSSPRPPEKPPDEDEIEPDTGVLTTKVVGDISELYVHVPNVFPPPTPLSPMFDTLLPFSSENDGKVFNHGILASNEEKSPHPLSHRGFKAFQLFSESPMMIYGGNIPTLDVPIAPDYEASRARDGLAAEWVHNYVRHWKMLLQQVAKVCFTKKQQVLILGLILIPRNNMVLPTLAIHDAWISLPGDTCSIFDLGEYSLVMNKPCHNIVVLNLLFRCVIQCYDILIGKRSMKALHLFQQIVSEAVALDIRLLQGVFDVEFMIYGVRFQMDWLLSGFIICVTLEMNVGRVHLWFDDRVGFDWQQMFKRRISDSDSVTKGHGRKETYDL
ncbi:hypothetical protein Tco_0710841, partial [Tanacetum coccineum]